MALCRLCGKNFQWDTGIRKCSDCRQKAVEEDVAEQADKFLDQIEGPTPMQYPVHGAQFTEDVLINKVRYSVEVMTPTTVQLKLRPVPIEPEG